MRFEIEYGGETIVFHRDERLLWSATRPLRLTERQAVLLQMLCTMPDRTVTRLDYAQAVNGREWDPRQRLPLDQYIHGLRRGGLRIAARRGLGYALLGAVRRLDETPEPGAWAPLGLAAGDDGPARFWLDDRGHWLPVAADHESGARQLLGLADGGAGLYLLRRSGFVQLYLGAGRCHAVFDEAAVAPAALRAVHDFLSTQAGYDRVGFETAAGGRLEFPDAGAALAWLDRAQGLSGHLAPGTVVEEALDPARCAVPEIRELLAAWHTVERDAFYGTMQAWIRRARGHRAGEAPVRRVLCIEPDREGEPVYTEVGPGILMYGANSALYLGGRRVCEQAAPGYAQRAAEHYRRALLSEVPVLARIRSTVRLRHGVQALEHLRLSLPTSTSGGRQRAVVARTVNI